MTEPLVPIGACPDRAPHPPGERRCTRCGACAQEQASVRRAGQTGPATSVTQQIDAVSLMRDCSAPLLRNARHLNQTSTGTMAAASGSMSQQVQACSYFVAVIVWPAATDPLERAFDVIAARACTELVPGGTT